jgi:hypothetical protein
VGARFIVGSRLVWKLGQPMRGWGIESTCIFCPNEASTAPTLPYDPVSSPWGRREVDRNWRNVSAALSSTPQQPSRFVPLRKARSLERGSPIVSQTLHPAPTLPNDPGDRTRPHHRGRKSVGRKPLTNRFYVQWIAEAWSPERRTVEVDRSGLAQASGANSLAGLWNSMELLQL